MDSNASQRDILDDARLLPGQKVTHLLRLRGMTIAAFCEALGVSYIHFWNVINYRRESRTLKGRIAETLGVDRVKLFPER